MHEVHFITLDMQKNVLIIGAGGREHALAWKIAQSPLLGKLYISPGNAGTSEVGINLSINLDRFSEVKQSVLSNAIHLIIIGPEVPLVNGISDQFKADPDLKHIPVIGPGRAGAMLEGSKDFAKQFMAKYDIPTAGFKTFDDSNLDQAIHYLETLHPPFVLKADGLAAGKGVIITPEREEAQALIHEMIAGEKFGAASKKVVIEEFLDGIECSVFVLTDGKNYKILPEAKDYKRIGEGDTGLNRGGMGSISPVPFDDDVFMNKVEQSVIIPTIQGLQKEGVPYQGFIFFGLMKVEDRPYVIEYNVRMGDPETESVVPRIQSDLLEMLLATAEGRLESYRLEIDPRFCTSVFLVSGGYPGNYEKNKVISNVKNVKDVQVFHAGTIRDTEGKTLLTQGGRVLAVSAFGDSMAEALKKAYREAEAIQFDGKYFRKDIGRDLMSEE